MFGKYDYYQLGFINGQPSKEHKSLIRKGVLVETRVAEEVNRNYLDTAKWYEVDEEATKEYQRQSKEHNEKRERGEA